MTAENSPNDLFRFSQLRPQRLAEETPTVPLLSDTPLARALIAAPNAQRRTSLANSALKGRADTLDSVDQLPLAPEIVAALQALAQNPEATTADLVATLPNLPAALKKPAFESRGIALSNTLLAAYYASEGFPPNIPQLQHLHRVYHLLRQERDGTEAEPVLLSSYLQRRLLAPAVAREPSGAGARARSAPVPAVSPAPELAAAIGELGRLDRREHLVQPAKNGLAVPRGGVPFSLAPSARQRLSKGTATLLKARGLDTSAVALDVVVQSLHDEWLSLAGAELVWPTPDISTLPGVTLPPAPLHALVKPAGVAELLVVRQQIKRYEAGEIAHVENVLSGEKKSRAHRQLDRSEETVATDSELTRQQETELTTADRFELNRETSRTVEQDQKLGFGLSLSGKYGPTVEFSANSNLETSTATEESNKSSSRYAKDVVNRSLERVTERTREQRSRTTIRETEETNLHELTNPTGPHVRGIYQFIDKVYEAQVFNYGVREIFDFMVPEPASLLWYLEDHPTLDLRLPPAPPKLELVLPNAGLLDENLALTLSATYGATDIEPPPALYKRLTVQFKHGTDNASESGKPHSNEQKEASLPAGYRPLRAWVQALAFTDNNPVIAVAIGAQQVYWQPAATGRVTLSGGTLCYQPQLFMDLSAEPFEQAGDAKLGVSMMAFETNMFTVNVVIVLQRIEEEMARWRLATYKKIRGAYEDAVRQYEQQVEALRAAAEAKAAQEARRPFGAPPAENARTIATELKKHCISIVTQQRFDAFDATKDGTPPYFDFDEAAAEGAYIRFFEQAFEWDQLQYVFYPYFWARKSEWAEHFVKQDVDPLFLDFLRAGSARVVVPVRPGFESAVTHFLGTGKIWGGSGEPPQIDDPNYVSIITEIRERTGAPQSEVPVGEPWEVRVPTALALLRSGGTLPSWERVTPGEWDWRPVPES